MTTTAVQQTERVRECRRLVAEMEEAGCVTFLLPTVQFFPTACEKRYGVTKQPEGLWRRIFVAVVEPYSPPFYSTLTPQISTTSPKHDPWSACFCLDYESGCRPPGHGRLRSARNLRSIPRPPFVPSLFRDFFPGGGSAKSATDPLTISATHSLPNPSGQTTGTHLESTTFFNPPGKGDEPL